MSTAELPAENAGTGSGSGSVELPPIPTEARSAYEEKLGDNAEEEEERKKEEEDDDGNVAEGRQEMEEPRSGDVAPSRWRRLLTIFIISILLWFALTVLSPTKEHSKVVYASRYSKDHRFRPAASPIVTERLKDGRTRLRGAQPTMRKERKIRKAKRSGR